VNAQLDEEGTGYMRHEDHVGHKIQYANGEGDLNEAVGRVFGNSLTGGVVIREVAKRDDQGQSYDHISADVRCYIFNKIHQGVHSADALTNNDHELISHIRCWSFRSDVPDHSMSIISGLVGFGPKGSFKEFCSGTGNLGRDTQIFPDTNRMIPHFDPHIQQGMRNIPTYRCNNVSRGNITSYEIWSGGLKIVRPDGTELASVSGGWEVLDTIRYYDTNSPKKIGYTSDVCVQMSANRIFDPGPGCNVTTNYGQISYPWNDTRSYFKGLHRGQYIMAHVLNNAGGPTVVYTDAFGRKASNTPFKGSVKQTFSAHNFRVTGRREGIDPINILHRLDDGEGAVHAPN
jgi:hypothetical protein